MIVVILCVVLANKLLKIKITLLVWNINTKVMSPQYICARRALEFSIFRSFCYFFLCTGTALIVQWENVRLKKEGNKSEGDLFHDEPFTFQVRWQTDILFFALMLQVFLLYFAVYFMWLYKYKQLYTILLAHLQLWQDVLYMRALVCAKFEGCIEILMFNFITLLNILNVFNVWSV